MNRIHVAQRAVKSPPSSIRERKRAWRTERVAERPRSEVGSRVLHQSVSSNVGRRCDASIHQSIGFLHLFQQYVSPFPANVDVTAIPPRTLAVSDSIAEDTLPHFRYKSKHQNASVRERDRERGASRRLGAYRGSRYGDSSRESSDLRRNPPRERNNLICIIRIFVDLYGSLRPSARDKARE